MRRKPATLSSLTWLLSWWVATLQLSNQATLAEGADSPLRQRQANGELGPAAFLTFDGDGTVVRLDDGLGDVEAESEAAVVAAGDVAGPVEALEQLRDLVFRDADAIVDDRREHIAAVHVGIELDVAPLGGVLDGVGEEVVDDLSHAVGVDVHRRLGNGGVEGDAAGSILHTEGATAAIEELQPADGLPVDLQAVGLDARDVEQFRDQAHHAVDLPENGVEVGGALVGREVVHGLCEELCVALDRRERSAQLVRGDGEELILLAVELLQRGNVADDEDGANDAIALDRRGANGKVEVLAVDDVPADGEVVGDRCAAQCTRIRKVFARDGAAVRIADVEALEVAILDGLGTGGETEHGQGGLVDVDDLAVAVVDPEAVGHRAQDRVEPGGALGHHLGQRFDLALGLDLISDVLNEDGQALGDAREPAADGADDTVDVDRIGARADLELFVDAHVARFGDLPQDALEPGDHFRHAQLDDARIGRDLAEVRSEVEQPGVGELEPQLVGRDDGDANRCRLEYGFETDARVDFPAGQLLGGAMAFQRHAGEAMDVAGRADALRHGLPEFEILGVKVAPVV